MIKTLTNLFKQDKEKFVVPKGVQDVIPVAAIFDDGIFKVGKDKYSKTYRFTDINYAVASREDKEAMFLEYSELLNSLDSGATTKITINNRRLNRLDFEQTILIPTTGDNLDEYREEYNKMLLDKAEEMGWNWEAYIEPGSRRTYVEIGQSSPAGEDFSMVIDFDEENQADSFKDSLEAYYEDFDIDEHIEMWIEAKRSGTSGVPSTRELVKDAEAIDGMISELSQALQKVNIPVLVGSYTPPDENGEGEKIVREFYGQGHIFKDEDAFYHRPDDPCYIPELSDTVYTRNSILQECNQQDDLAEEVFEALDWQHVSSLLEDWQRNGELDTCKECGKMFNCYGVTKCPYCGADYEGGDE